MGAISGASTASSWLLEDFLETVSLHFCCAHSADSDRESISTQVPTFIP